MAFDSFADFLQMGTHGFYVWLAYGLTFAVLVWLAGHALTGHRRARRELSAQRLRNTQTPNTQTPNTQTEELKS